MTIVQTYNATLIILLIGLLITTIEQLFISKDYKDNFLNWNLNKGTYCKTPRLINNILDYLFKNNTFIILMYVRLLLIVFSLLSIIFFGFKLFVPLLLISTTLYLFNLRNFQGLDGSDQMFLICMTATTIWSVSPSDKMIAILSTGFIAFQLVLSYTTAGIAKINSPLWRSSYAIVAIMDTKSFGNAKISGLLLDHKLLRSFLSWIVICWESFFLFSVFDQYAFLIFLLIGIIFHLFNAIIMGLNGFFWAFVSAYPSLIFIRSVLCEIIK